MIGFALGVLKISDLLHSEIPGARAYKTFVFDESAPPGEQIIFPKTTSYQTRSDIKERFCADSIIYIAEYPYQLVHCSTDEYDYLAHHHSSLIALLAGFSITILVTLYLFTLIKQKSDGLILFRKLQASETRYSEIVDSTQIMIQSIDPSNGKYLFTNNGWRAALGYSGDEWLNLTFTDVVHPDELQYCQEVLAKALSGELVEDVNTTFVSKDGSKVEVKGHVFCSKVGTEKEVTHGVFSDVTKRNEAVAQVIQASKLATLGEMATSVAHELNQPLNVIRMAGGNVLRKIEKGTADPAYLKSKLDRIINQTARAAAIIDHMRMFGREASEEPELLVPAEIMSRAVNLMTEQLRLSEIEVVMDLSDERENRNKILGHSIQLEQVLLNLLTNARDAILDNGNVRRIALSVRCDDKTVRMAVQDTGGGIPERDIGRIFEPFFTTKEMGKGTGLGLSVSYGIIRDMGGTIAAENVENGARFTISLPVAESGP